MTREIVLQAENVVKRVGQPAQELTILNGVDLTVCAAESLALIGRSGAGKSTLLALLAGLDRPSSGKIHLLGRDISDDSEDERAAQRVGRVGFVFQSFQLLQGLSALENVMLPMELAGKKQARTKAVDTLNAVGLGNRLSHKPRQLSGGEQQRVAVARAFAVEPQILFADEPTGNLDDATSTTVVELLFRLNESRDTTLVLVTHDQQLAMHCDRQVTLHDGLVIEGSQ